MRPRSLENRLKNRFLLITNSQRSPTTHDMQRVPDRACLRTTPVLASSHLSLDGMIPTSTTASTSPPTSKALFEFPGRTSHILSTTCDECSLLGSHVSSSKASATSFHLSPKIDAPCNPRTKAQQKSEATLSTREVYSLVVGSPGLFPVPSALCFQNCVSYQTKPSPTEWIGRRS